MPVCTYQCEECEHRFSAVQKFTAVVLVQCPKCGQMTLKKVQDAIKQKNTPMVETLHLEGAVQ
jgi:putative FmdB family regulatory protein